MISCQQHKPDEKDIKEIANQSVNKIEKFYCMIKNIEDKPEPFLKIDFIDYLKTSEALEKEKIVFELPNDSSFVNKVDLTENIFFADDVKIKMQKFSFDSDGNFKFNQSISLSDLINDFKYDKQHIYISSPFEIIVTNKKIIQLKEIYIP
jgi:hypothetical protein